MKEKIRLLTVAGHALRVSNVHGILDNDRFVGEMPHAFRDYYIEPDAIHAFDEGEESANKTIFRSVRLVYSVGHRYYMESSNDVVSEITPRHYHRLMASSGILVDHGIWWHLGEIFNSPKEAALRAYKRFENVWTRWNSLSDDGKALTVLSDIEVGKILADCIVGDTPCAYNADVYCANDARAMAAKVLSGPVLRFDYFLKGANDSNLVPQPLIEREVDAPEHCACGPDCTDAIVLSDGEKIGAMLPGQSLTEEGERYVLSESCNSPSEITDIWLQAFRLSPSKVMNNPLI